MNQAKPIILLALIAGLGYWAWGVFFPSPEDQIKHALQDLAQTASFRPNEKSLARLGAITKVPTFFHTNAVVRISSGRYSGSLEGKQQIREAVAGSRTVASSLRIELTDPKITLKGPSQATVLVTATVYIDGDPTPQMQILRLQMVEGKRKWLVKELNPIDLDDV